MVETSPGSAAVAEQVASAALVAPRGSGTQWAIGGEPPSGAIEVAAPADAIHHDPADLTVSVDAGVTVERLGAVLAEAGQECALDPRDPTATIGGVVACGLSGPRRRRHGPLRDRVLGVEFVLADGRVVRGGGPTVKNVSGYDVPRLLVGSLGTLGLITRLTLRCSPRPAATLWASSDADPTSLLGRLHLASCIAWDGSATRCLLEGHPSDLDDEMRAAGLEECAAPTWPTGPFRARASVRPSTLTRLGAALDAVAGLGWMAEIGVGTVHVAADAPDLLLDAREAVRAAGGWLLVEEGSGLDPYGTAIPNAAVMARLKAALDPGGKMNPGRIPL